MPDSEVEAVVALAGWSGAIAPIAEILSRFGRAVFVIAKRRVGTVFESTPRGAVARVELGRVAVFIGEIARGEDFSRDFLDEFGGGFRSSQS